MATGQSSRRESIDEQSSVQRGSSSSSVRSIAIPDTSFSRQPRLPAARLSGLADHSLTSRPENPAHGAFPGQARAQSHETVPTMRSSTQANMLEGPITYTPTTHRISKAKKGKRVHACEFPGCNKIFTRAEHRRRHELNHSPEASFPCPHAGCRKAFHRPDLLARHIERHELDAQGDGIYRHERNPSDVTSDSGRSMTQQSMVTSASPLAGGRRGPDNRVTVTSIVTPSMTSQSYPLHSTPLWTTHYNLPDRTPVYPELMPNNLTDEPAYSSPEGDGSLSPMSDNYAHYRPARNSLPSVPMIDPFSYDPIMKPMPSAPSVSVWPGIEHDIPQPPQLISHGYDERDHPSVEHPVQLSLANLEWDTWFSVRGQLGSIPGFIPNINGMEGTDAVKCIGLYWKHFHPLFPIIHQPSFDLKHANPLIAASMIAIGSQYDDRHNAKAFSIGMLEACTKYMAERKVEPITSRSNHVTDLQSVIMLEVLAKFRSRRANVGFSAHFKRLYESLAQDRHWISMNPLRAFETLPEDSDSVALEQAYQFWIGHETRRRILQSCYILDLQQSVLFEQRGEFNHVRALLFKGKGGSQHELPMPCASELWEAKTRDEWQTLVKKQEPPLSLSASTDEFLFPTMATHLDNDPFATSLLLAHILTYRTKCSDTEENLCNYYKTLKTSHPSHNRTLNLFRYHSLLAAHYAPVRALLTVSGESWLFNKKLDREPDFLAAKGTLRSWVSENRDIKRSVWHAIQVLRISMRKQEPQEPACSSSANEIPASAYQLPHQPYHHQLSSGKYPLNTIPSAWSIYLCALICWAYGFDHSFAVNYSRLPLSDAKRSFSSETSSSASSSGGGGGVTTNGISSSSSAASTTTTANSQSTISSKYNMPSPITVKRESDTYMQAMDIADSPDRLDDVDSMEKGRTRCVLEWVRRNVVKGEGGGLLNEAEGVLLRLVEGRSRLVGF